MDMILDRLYQSFGVQLEDLDLSVFPENTIQQYLATLDSNLLSNLVRHHAQLSLEYTLYCSYIAKAWAKNQDAQQLENTLNVALKKAMFLEIVYDHYLNMPHEVHRLRLDRKALHHHLERIKIESPLEIKDIRKKIHDTTPKLNLLRLILLRLKRLLMATVLLVDKNTSFYGAMQSFDRYATPAFSSLACFFFIPRIADNLAMIIEHTFYPTTPEAKRLGYAIRFNIQLYKRWPDLTNDLPWFVANVVSYFYLVGPLACYSPLLSISMQLYEIAQASAQWHYELKYLRQQRESYLNLIPKNDQGMNFKDYIKELSDRITFEDQRLWIPVWNTTVLLVAIILASPLLAFNPLFAVAGGLLSVSTTVCSYRVREALKKTNPTVSLFPLVNHSFFSPLKKEERASTPALSMI